MPDPFDFDTGGFVEDYQATTVDCTFSPGQYNFQATLTNRYDEPIIANDGTLLTERRVFITVGGLEQWRATNGGRSFEHTTGENYTPAGKSKVRANSGWAEYVRRLIELAGRDVVASKGDPFSAEIAEGWHLHWATEGAGVPYEFTGRDGTLQKGFSKGKPMPDRLLDAGETQTAFDLDALALPPDTLDRLSGLAASASTKDQFAKAVMPVLGEFPETHRKVVIDALGDDSFRVALGGLI